MKIYEKLLELRDAVVAQEGKLIRVVLDEKGATALQCEIDALLFSPNIGDFPHGDTRRLFGITVDVAKECPACGQSMEETK